MGLLDPQNGSLRAPDGQVTDRWSVDPETGIVHREQAEDVESVIDHNAHLRDFLPKYHGHAAWRHCASIPSTIANLLSRECGAAPGSPEFAAYAKRQIVLRFPKLLVKGW